VLTDTFIDLGSSPPSNSYLTSESMRTPENWYPLKIMFCTMVQILGDKAQVKFAESKQNLHEAEILRLDSTRAKDQLGWRPQWSLQQTLQATVDWYRDWQAGLDMELITQKQISDFIGNSVN
jgi:hypothetical protein